MTANDLSSHKKTRSHYAMVNVDESAPTWEIILPELPEYSLNIPAKSFKGIRDSYS